MLEAQPRSWFSFLLFWLTLAVAAFLFLLVLLAPVLDNGAPGPEGWERWLALFEETAREICAPAAVDWLMERARRIAKSLHFGIQAQRGVLP